MKVVCPKCASLEAESLSYIYREGALHMRATGARFGPAGPPAAAPPAKRIVTGWLLITIVFGGLFISSLRSFGTGSIIFAAIALLGIWMAMHNREYNTARFPALYTRWQQSFRCNQCGAVFPVT